MQEKAAHRLLAHTLHQQMLEELRKNPALAADPDQQIQFKRLAQQQLLYQMALAAQAATGDELPAVATSSIHPEEIQQDVSLLLGRQCGPIRPAHRSFNVIPLATGVRCNRVCGDGGDRGLGLG